MGAGGLNYTPPADVSKSDAIAVPGSGTTNPQTYFLITATPQGGMTGTSTQKLDSQGNKGPQSDWEQ